MKNIIEALKNQLFELMIEHRVNPYGDLLSLQGEKIVFTYGAQLCEPILRNAILDFFADQSKKHPDYVFDVQGCEISRGFSVSTAPDILKRKLDIDVSTTIKETNGQLNVQLNDKLNIFGNKFEKKAEEAVMFLSSILFQKQVCYDGKLYQDGKAIA